MKGITSKLKEFFILSFWNNFSFLESALYANLWFSEVRCTLMGNLSIPFDPNLVHFGVPFDPIWSIYVYFDLLRYQYHFNPISILLIWLPFIHMFHFHSFRSIWSNFDPLRLICFDPLRSALIISRSIMLYFNQTPFIAKDCIN